MPWRRNIEVGLPIEELKLRRHHSDDDVRLIFDKQLLPDDVGITSEAPHPEAMAQHHAVLFAAFFLLFRAECASKHRLSAEERQEAGCNSVTVRQLRFSRAGDGRHVWNKTHDAFEEPRTFPIEHLR